jgi:hypothetical protein
MQTPENFINWLEGYLDACNNKLTSTQVKSIRKKIEDLRSADLVPRLLFDSYQPAQVTQRVTNPVKSQEDHAEFLKEIERNRNATTLEELS